MKQTYPCWTIPTIEVTKSFWEYGQSSKVSKELAQQDFNIIIINVLRGHTQRVTKTRVLEALVGTQLQWLYPVLQKAGGYIDTSQLQCPQLDYLGHQVIDFPTIF